MRHPARHRALGDAVAAAPVRGLTTEQHRTKRFEEIVLPRLDSAYNLARWLTRNDADAQDVVQQACLRAFKYFDGFDGQYANAWLLKIVRNTYYTWLKQNRPTEEAMSLDDNLEEIDANESAMQISASGLGRSPETLLSERRDARRLDEQIERLPPVYREIIVLREMDELSYREIADIIGVPIGTVMSRLARGRHKLRSEWADVAK